MEDKINTKAFAYIPSLYFGEGLPYVVINIVSVVMYTKMGIGKGEMAFWTSFLYLPWVLKMFWSPLLESSATRVRWIISTQLVIAAIFAFIGLTIHLENFFLWSMLGFFTGAFISATYDIATDGYYILMLNEKSQSFFVGIRTFFYRLAMIFGSGLLVMFAGKIEAVSGVVSYSWTAAFLLLFAFFALSGLYHSFVLPRDPKPAARQKDIWAEFRDSFKAYFTQKNIWLILLIILIYRLGEASLEKMIPPFMLDPQNFGGLGIDTETFGFVKGIISMAALIAGNILGGLALAKYGFKKCIWPFVILLNVPNIFYVIMAVYQPSLTIVGALIAFEQFGYGLGFMAFTVFVLIISRRSKYPTSHYAISTGVMALGMMLPNMLSGKLVVLMGYANFFALVCALSVPSILLPPLILKIIGESEQ